MNMNNETYSVSHIDEIKTSNRDLDIFSTRIVEALLFSNSSPMSLYEIAEKLPHYADIQKILRKLQAKYEGSGIELYEINQKWIFRTAPDLAEYMVRDIIENKKLSKSALETLGIVAYHQPVTRTEIESIRGVAVSKGTLDILMEMGWIKLGRRRETPGRPLTFITTDSFLEHFGLRSIKDLPGIKELKEAGFLDSAGKEITEEEMKFLLEESVVEPSNSEMETQQALYQEDLFEKP